MSNRGVLVAKYHKLLSFSWILMFQIWQKKKKSHTSNFWRIRNEIQHILLHNFFLGSVHKYSGGGRVGKSRRDHFVVQKGGSKNNKAGMGDQKF